MRFDDLHAVVWGLGRHGGGVAVSRYLSGRGARVSVVDNASAETLARSIDALADCHGVSVHPDTSVLADHIAPADLLVINPAIAPTHPDLVRLQDRHPSARLTTELDLVLEELRDVDVIAVTGSNGKSTVAAWAARCLREFGRWDTVWLGGNFEAGLSADCPSPLLERMSAASLPSSLLVVLELSSFQLARCDLERLRPFAGAVTNVTPNHLEWHGDMTSYSTAKGRLVEACLAGGSSCVLPLRSDDPLRQQWHEAAGTVRPDVLSDGALHASADAENAATVKTLCRLVDVDIRDDELFAQFPSLPHRFQKFGVFDDVCFIDDSASTSPESTIASLDRLSGQGFRSVGLIVGGRNKGFDVREFARSISTRADAIATIGETGSDIAKQIAIFGGKVRSHRTLSQAVRRLGKLIGPGGSVVLSPGMASTDQFEDYRDRGRQFQRLALETNANKDAEPH